MGTNTDATAETTAPQCRRCGASMVPVIYGFPSADLGEASFRGEVILGGCCIVPGQMPEWGCVSCVGVIVRRGDGRRQ